MKSRLLIIMAAFILCSCSVKQVAAPEAERIFKDAEIRSVDNNTIPLEDVIALEKRVKTYWDARMLGDGAKMYELEDPDVIKRTKLSLNGYIQSRSPAVIDKGYEVKGLEILSPEKVRVYIILQAFINLPQVMKDEKALIRDIWLKKQGNWYRWLVLNPFSTIPPEKMKGIEAKPYDGPLGSGVPKSDTKIEESPVRKEFPGGDLSKEKAAGGMPESGSKIEITPGESATPKFK